MNKFIYYSVLASFFFSISVFAVEDSVYLIIRGDDIGSAYAVNEACIESYTHGIVRTVEVMVPCPWFPEAVEMLRQHPDLDVGVHLTLTSEWDGYKWGPLVCAPSLVDSNGYFYPKQKNWTDPDAKNAFWNAQPDMKEVEAELRAQIETAIKHIPQVSHLSGHMGIFSPDVSPRMTELVKKLAKEYNLDIDPENFGVQKLNQHYKTRLKENEQDPDQVDAFVEMLENLQPGIYLYIEHPGKNCPELKALSHPGSKDIGIARGNVTDLFTSDKVKNAIRGQGIRLISYADLEKLK